MNMKKSFLLIVLLIAFSRVVTGQTLNEHLSELAWLEGKWERDTGNQNQSAFEEWEINEDMLTGVGVTLQRGDTVFVEKLSITFKDGDLYYVADVNPNAEPVYFRITEFSATGFVSENPEHDFPKKIEYRLESEGQLIATISGGGRSIPFEFHKVED